MLGPSRLGQRCATHELLAGQRLLLGFVGHVGNVLPNLNRAGRSFPLLGEIELISGAPGVAAPARRQHGERVKARAAASPALVLARMPVLAAAGRQRG